VCSFEHLAARLKKPALWLMNCEHIQSDHICLSCGKAMRLARTSSEISGALGFAHLRLQGMWSGIYGKRGGGKVARELNTLGIEDDARLGSRAVVILMVGCALSRHCEFNGKCAVPYGMRSMP
jgi:hypothetical protein